MMVVYLSVKYQIFITLLALFSLYADDIRTVGF
jgi:hypothetical protein